MFSRLITLCIFSFSVFCGATASAQVNQAPETMEPAAFASLLELPATQLLDVRTAKEFRTGYIKTALQADWLNPKEFRERTTYLDRTKPVLVYCASGVRSAEAAAALRTSGYRVIELSGGLNLWKKEGFALKGATDTRQLTNAEFEEMIKSNGMVLVDFGAEWCPPCRRMEPVLQKFQQEAGNALKLVKIDGGIHTNLMKSMNVTSLPHFFMYSNGKKVWEKQGLVTLEELKAALTQSLGSARK